MQNVRGKIASPYYMMNNSYSKQKRMRQINPYVNAEGVETANKMKNSDYFKGVFDKTDVAIKGALLGAAIGLGFGLYRHKSYFIYSVVGGAIGYVAANFLSKKYFKQQ